MTLGCATELGQAIGDRGRGVVVGHHTDGCRFHGEARLVGVVEPEILVVQRAGRDAGQDSAVLKTAITRATRCRPYDRTGASV